MKVILTERVKSLKMLVILLMFHLVMGEIFYFQISMLFWLMMPTRHVLST